MIYHNQFSSSNNVDFPATLVDIVARAYELKNRIELHPSILLSINFILHTRASNFVNSMVQSATTKSLSAASRRIAAEGLIAEIESKPISNQINLRFTLEGWFKNQFNQGVLIMEISRELTVENVIAFIKKVGGGVSFVELINHFKDTNGCKELSIRGNSYSNIVLWTGMSEKFCDVMENVEASSEIEMVQVDTLVYVIDGIRPRLPIVKSMRHYKSPRWLPVAYDLK